jgi:hypothetical protein
MFILAINLLLLVNIRIHILIIKFLFIYFFIRSKFQCINDFIKIFIYFYSIYFTYYYL